MANWLKKNACFVALGLIALAYVAVAEPSVAVTLAVSSLAGIAGGVLDLLRKK